MMSSRAVKIGFGLYAIGWAFRNPWKLLAILVPLGMLQCTFHFFGWDIPEADFPKLVEVLRVVQQPYQTHGAAMIEVRNNAKTWLQPEGIVFICRYVAPDGPGVRRGYMIATYYHNAGETFEPGTTKIVPARTASLLGPDMDLSGCKAAKTEQQARALYGLKRKNITDYDDADSAEPWQPSQQLSITRYRS